MTARLPHRSASLIRRSSLLRVAEMGLWILAVAFLGLAIGMQADAFIYQHFSHPLDPSHTRFGRAARAFARRSWTDSSAQSPGFKEKRRSSEIKPRIASLLIPQAFPV